VNARDDNGETALIMAVFNEQIKIVELLLEAGADVNVMAVNGETALMLAKEWENNEIIEMLKEAGARR